MQKKYTLLYVEDDINVQQEMVGFFEDYFKDIYVGSNGEEGLKFYQEHHIDLLITDLTMPKMDGIELIATIKTKNQDLKTLVVTAHSDQDNLLKSIKMGVNGFILKPLDFSELEREITLQIKALDQQQELKEKEQLLQEYKDAVDESSIFSKSDIYGRITYVNEKFCELSGYTQEELIGKQHNIVRHPDMPKEVFEELWETIKIKKKTWSGRIKNRSKNGEYYWVDSTIKPILNSKDEIIEFIGIRHDITALEEYRLTLKSELSDTHQSLDEQLNYMTEYEDAINNNSAIVKTNLDLIITYVNDSYKQLTNYTKKEMLGKAITEFVDHESLHDVEKILSQIQAGQVYQGIFKGKPKYGKPYYTKTTIKPMKDLNENIVEYLMIKNDVTDLIELQDEIVSTQKEVIETVGMIGETRSKETGEHVKRVAEYSYLLARLYGLKEEESLLIKRASPMHDIGKIAIPDHILNKPGKLTVQEFDVMKTHSQIGYDMLKFSKREILKAAATVAHTHHEKWDGTGYPNKIAGEEIHIYGRITTIADVFDALGHDRVYKKAWELDRILELFKDQRAKQFDPILTDLFLENINSFLEIQKNLKV